jgi:hypothetical protein
VASVVGESCGAGHKNTTPSIVGMQVSTKRKKSVLGPKGMSNMFSHDKIAETIESQEVAFDEEAVQEASQIEEILNRAYEIHRSHGGLFGYDLEDWLQAQRELAGRNRADQFRAEEKERAESVERNQERNCEQWFGLND